MLLMTREELENHMEKNREILRSRGELPRLGTDYEKINLKLNVARNTSELITLIEEIDPVNYKIVYAFSETFSYLGVAVWMRLMKDEDYKRFPSNNNSVFDVEKVADTSPIPKSYTMISSDKVIIYKPNKNNA